MRQRPNAFKTLSSTLGLPDKLRCLILGYLSIILIISLLFRSFLLLKSNSGITSLDFSFVFFATATASDVFLSSSLSFLSAAVLDCGGSGGG